MNSRIYPRTHSYLCSHLYQRAHSQTYPRTSARAGIARAVLAALLITASPFAWSHAYPTHQEPGAGSTVPATLKNIVIDFDDGLEPAFSSITVTDAQGKAVTHGKAVVDAANTKRMSVALDPLAAGVYTVSWVALALDGHRTQGHYTFTAQ